MLTESEQAVLSVFRKFRISRGEMLCFHGPDLLKHKPALNQLAAKEMLQPETFNGGYTLTASGFNAMKQHSPVEKTPAAKPAVANKPAAKPVATKAAK